MIYREFDNKRSCQTLRYINFLFVESQIIKDNVAEEISAQY